MATSIPVSLQSERLMEHMQVLCKEIGPRPPTSEQERQAAEYVKQQLQAMGYSSVEEQPFKSQNSIGWITVPAAVAGALGVPLAYLGGRLGKALGGLLMIGGAVAFSDAVSTRPPFFQELIARGNSQNVILTIPPAGETKRRVYLVGHLDSQKQRFMSPPDNSALMKPIVTGSFLLGLLGGFSLLADALWGRRRVTLWQGLAGVALALGLVSVLRDEVQPHIEGANDNVTAVSILLSIAELLREQPLQETEIVLLFTGCEEVVCVGMENYLRQFRPSREDTYWIDLEMVGTGELCYVTRHGVDYLNEYCPDPEMVELAERVADRYPELRVTGREILILEEVSNLRRHDYRAICVAGYDEQGYLPNWHRLSDNLENIEPETLSRAAQYTWALLQELDADHRSGAVS